VSNSFFRIYLRINVPGSVEGKIIESTGVDNRSKVFVVFTNKPYFSNWFMGPPLAARHFSKIATWYGCTPYKLFSIQWLLPSYYKMER